MESNWLYQSGIVVHLRCVFLHANLQCAQRSESRVLTAVNESLINDSLVDVSPDTCLALLIRPRERERAKKGSGKNGLHSLCVFGR